MTDRKSSTTKSTGRKPSKGLSEEELDALKERVKEQKAEARGKKSKADGERDVLDKIAEMPEPDRAMAKRIHAIVKEVAPTLAPKTWYGMPGYANEDGKVLCFFTPAAKFKERYATFGFNADAHLDDGPMWPTSWALTELTEDAADRIGKLVKQAVSQPRK